jgi:hypothetical protein
MNSVDRLAVVCKVLLDTRVLELRRENEALKLRLFWKEHGPEQLKAAMRMANAAAGGPGCGCLGCKVGGRNELAFSNVAGKDACAFKAWFEAILKELDMDVAVSLPAAAVWVHVKEVDPDRSLLDDGVQPLDPGLEPFEPLLVERLVDPAVHPVAGEDEIGADHPQHPIEPLEEVGPGKLSAGMPFLGQPGDGLAREADVDHLPVDATPLQP